MNPAKEGFRMSKKSEKLDELTEKTKELPRMQYDYFKHLTTLSTGSILIIVAFLEKVFNEPRGSIVVVISLICFAFCLIGSLLALPLTGNVIMYITFCKIEALKGNEKKAKEFGKKGEDSLKEIGIYDDVSRYSFLAGIIAFLIFAGINFFK